MPSIASVSAGLAVPLICVGLAGGIGLTVVGYRATLHATRSSTHVVDSPRGTYTIRCVAEHEPDRNPYMGETVRGPWLVSVTGPSASDLGFRDAEPFATQHAALARVRQIEAELRRLPHTEA